MKELWTDNPQTIAHEIDSLIEKKADIFCGRGGKKEIKKLLLMAKSKSQIGDLLVVHHPHEPSCTNGKCLYYYHVKGNPLRCFEAERVKKVKDLLGLKYPGAIYNIHQRQFPRVTTAGNSTVVYSRLHKQRLFSGKVEDISLEGGKFLVDLPMMIGVGDILCHITLTLCSRFSGVEETKVHIPEAKVMWRKGDEDHTRAIGVKFAWHEKGQEALSTYIDLRMIEDPEGSGA
jgi:hypothetical protein